MILIISHKEDYTTDFVVNKLNLRNINYKRLNCEDLLNKTFAVSRDLILNFEGQTDFKSVWFRRTKLPAIEHKDIAQKIYLLNEYDALIKNLFCTINARWLSNPFDIYKAENKLYQLKIASKLGFIIPDTLITNSKETLREFYIKNLKQVIIKPLSQSRLQGADETEFIFTNDLEEAHILELDKYDLTPCIYQQKIDKNLELRITVVGEEIFVAGVDSQNLEISKTDWRKGVLKFYKTEIPLNLEEKCRQLVKNLNLKFGAIDLIKDKEGNYIFLEINPNGQWAWIENETGLKISEAIINELIC